MATQAQSLSSILARTSIDDPEDVLKTCNEALKKSKNNLEVQHAKVVALLKLDRYPEALHVYETAGDDLRDRAKLELSYALYKVGKLEESTKAALEAGGHAAKHVAAQALYRDEHFAQAADIYKELEADDVAGEEHDLRINKGAVDAQLTWQGKADKVVKKKPDREDLEAYETAFNAACGSIARGEFGQADVLLRRAKELCRHSEDLAEDEKVGELLNISVQQLYVLEKLGKREDAEKLASEIKVEEISDLATKKVAQSTLISLQTQPENPFQLYKIFNSSKTETVGNDKLFSFQSDVYDSNSYAVDLLASKYDGVARSTAKAIKSHPGPKTAASVVSLSVVNAAAQARGATGKAAIKAIVTELEQRPTDVGLVILLVQLYISEKNLSSAIEVVEAFFKRLDASVSEQDRDIRYNPGLIAIQVALYKSQGRKAPITTELSKAAQYWRTHSKTPSKSLLLAAGKALLDSNDTAKDLESAREIFETLHAQYPDDKVITAGYIASHATTSPDSIQSSLSILPPVSDVIADIDVDALEEAGIPQALNSAARKVSIANALGSGPAGTASRKRGPGEDSKGPSSAIKKRRRLPKSRIPKDFVEGKTLDPDRWLPLRERASYRPKKGKKGKNRDAGGGTQGGVVRDDGGASTPKAEQPGVISGSGGGGGNKKKNKGKKK